ncbi:MAG TPA: tetratricopeptide repeat protein [Pyrinomonadaceae bacterium]|jgi:tetratricopeptide (TPR) repeat protein
MSIDNSDFINWILSADASSQALALEAAGVICEGRGHHKAAVEVLKVATEIKVNNIDVYQALARSYMALNLYDDAAIVLEKALSLYPDSFDIQSALLWCYTQPDSNKNIPA